MHFNHLTFNSIFLDFTPGLAPADSSVGNGARDSHRLFAYTHLLDTNRGSETTIHADGSQEVFTRADDGLNRLVREAFDAGGIGGGGAGCPLATLRPCPFFVPS